MERVTIGLETVTATFVHVDPQSDARWRAAPFRGLARWWFRAIVGATKDPAGVRRDEAALFGTAEHPSRVAFRVFPGPPGPASSWSAPINPGSSKKIAPRKALPPGARATLEILSTIRGQESKLALRCAYAALWVALHLGGVGQRSRRGSGSIRITHVEGVDEVPAPVEVAAADTYAAKIEAGLAQARMVLGASVLRTIPGLAEFPMLHPGCARVRVAAPQWPPGEAQARTALMTVRRRPEYHGSSGGEYEFGSIKPRLASPLWVRFGALNPTLVVLALFKHAAASRLGAQWEKAEDLMNSLDPEGVDIDLGGHGHA